MKITTQVVAISLWGAGLGVAWFFGLDRVHYEESCSSCYYAKSIQQYRVFSVVVSERDQEKPSLLTSVAEDLGVPCPHQNYSRRHTQRWRGLVQCEDPCISIDTIWDLLPEWYTPEVRTILTAAGAKDPELGRGFLDRVILKHDREYMMDLLDELEIETGSGM